jgi:integrase
MALKLKTYQGRPYYYLRGTVKANRKRTRIFESTGIRIGSPGAKTRAEELRLRREAALLEELVSGKPKGELTWTEVALLYCKERATRRLSKRPELAGTKDPEAGYVLRLTDFLKARKVADRPIRELTYEDIQSYFNDHLRRCELSYLHRCRNNYRAVMNWAVTKKHCGSDFPMPELPYCDPKKMVVNKNLPLEVIELFIRFAPRHSRLLFGSMFECGLRGGELLFVNRTPPDEKRPRRSGLCLEEGREHFYLGVTKDGKPVTRAIPRYLAKIIRAHLKNRKDGYDSLFLTDKGVPYEQSKVQRGSQYRKSWYSTRAKVLAELNQWLADAEVAGNKDRVRQLKEWISDCEKATGHWARHSMISRAIKKGKSDREVMSLSGHRSPQMIARYHHLRNEDARSLAEDVALDVESTAPATAPQGDNKRKRRTKQKAA